MPQRLSAHLQAESGTTLPSSALPPIQFLGCTSDVCRRRTVLREIKKTICALTLLSLPFWLTVTTIADAQGDTFAEPKKTLTDLVLSNQNVLLAGLALIATVVVSCLAVYGLRGLRDDLAATEHRLERIFFDLRSEAALQALRPGCEELAVIDPDAGRSVS